MVYWQVVEATRYVYGLGLVYEETGTAAKFYHFTRRGDTAAISDASGVVTDRASYGVYGELLSHTGSSDTPFLFNGLYGVQTDTNGLNYHRARYYNPNLRRFVNQDVLLGAIENSNSLNRFAYGNASPITLIDPLGYEAIVVDVSGFARTAWTAAELVEMLKTAAPNSIKDIVIKGHANQTEHTLTLPEKNRKDALFINATGSVDLRGAGLTGPVSLAPLLNGKMSLGANIHLEGCHAGSEAKTKGNPNGNNIARAISAEVTNVSVSGSALGTYWVKNGSGYDTYSVPFSINTYLNGSRTP